MRNFSANDAHLPCCPASQPSDKALHAAISVAGACPARKTQRSLLSWLPCCSACFSCLRATFVARAPLDESQLLGLPVLTASSVRVESSVAGTQHLPNPASVEEVVAVMTALLRTAPRLRRADPLPPPRPASPAVPGWYSMQGEQPSESQGTVEGHRAIPSVQQRAIHGRQFWCRPVFTPYLDKPKGLMSNNIYNGYLLDNRHGAERPVGRLE